MVMRQGLSVASAGLAVGLLLAWLAGRAIVSRLYGVTAMDPAAWSAAVGLSLISAAAANLALTSPVGSNYLVSDAKRTITAAITGASKQTLADDSLLKEHLRVELKRFIQKRTGAKPVITFVIVKA